MISKTKLLDLVKVFRWAEVAVGLAGNPKHLSLRDARGRNLLHLCASVDVVKKVGLNPADSVRLAEVLLEQGIDIDEPAFT